MGWVQRKLLYFSLLMCQLYNRRRRYQRIDSVLVSIRRFITTQRTFDESSIFFVSRRKQFSIGGRRGSVGVVRCTRRRRPLCGGRLHGIVERIKGGGRQSRWQRRIPRCCLPVGGWWWRYSEASPATRVGLVSLENSRGWI